MPGSSSSGLNNIPVVLVNQDSGQIGSSLVELFQSTDLAEIVTAQVLDDPVQARQLVDQDKVAAAIVIPPGFSASIIPVDGTAASLAPVQLELYANPDPSYQYSGIIKTILEEFVSRVEIARVGGLVAVTDCPQRPDPAPGCRSNGGSDWRGAGRPERRRKARRSR